MPVATVLYVVTPIALFAALYFVFGYAEYEGTMLEVQKIFYFHVSSAFTAFTAFAVTCICSVAYLVKRRVKYDLFAAKSAELGLIFCTIVLATGPIWARSSWNTWWNWEPRLTSTLILWLTYVGYFILRTSVSTEQKERFAAVFGIVAFLNVPIVYYSVKIWQVGSLHPPTTTRSHLAESMIPAWLFSWLALTLIYASLLKLNTGFAWAQYRLNKLQARTYPIADNLGNSI